MDPITEALYVAILRVDQLISEPTAELVARMIFNKVKYGVRYESEVEDLLESYQSKL